MTLKKIDSAFSSLSEWAAKHPLLILFLVFLIAFAVRSVSLRFEGSFDPDAHFHARMADEIVRTHQLVEWDFLSLQGRAYSYPPLLHVLLATLSILTGLDSMTVLKILGLLVGAFFSVSVFLLAFEWSKSYSIAAWSALFASISSIIVWRTAGFTRPDGIAVMLIPFILYLWLTHREKLAFVMSVALVFLHILSSFIFGVILGVWLLLGLLRKTSFPILLPFAMTGMVIAAALWFFSVGLPFSSFSSHLSLESSEMAQFIVIGFIFFFPFSWIFAFLGVWKEKLPTLLLAWLLLTLGIGMFGMRLAEYFIPFFSIAAGYGLFWLIKKVQHEKLVLPVLGFFLLILGCVSMWVLMDGTQPYTSESEMSAITFLGDTAHPSSSVLAQWDKGHVLSYFTGLPQVIDGYFEFGHELDARNMASRRAHSTSNCVTFLGALDEFHAHYFYVGKDDLHSDGVKYGVGELEHCPGARLLFSSDGARIYERVN